MHEGTTGMPDLPPWRQPPRGHFPGVPAWGAPFSAMPDDFAISPLAQVTPEWAWGGSDGSGVRVCVLDSGVDGAHPLVGGLDRAMEVMTGPGGDLIIGETAATDAAGHGTACASLIRSVAPEVSLSRPVLPSVLPMRLLPSLTKAPLTSEPGAAEG